MPTKPTVFTYHGSEYEIQKLKLHLRDAPRIVVKRNDIILPIGANVKYDPPVDDSQEPIAVYKFESHYEVIVGIGKALKELSDPERTEFQARLITKHVLKKAQYVIPSAAPVVENLGMFDRTDSRDFNRLGARATTSPRRDGGHSRPPAGGHFSRGR